MQSFRRATGLSQGVTMWRIQKVVTQVDAAVSNYIFVPTSTPETPKKVNVLHTSHFKENRPRDWEVHSGCAQGQSDAFMPCSSWPEWRSLQFA